MRPLASLSLDLDNQWSYMKTHGDPGWEALPSYLDVVVPRVLELLADRRLTITWFIVGQDAALERHHGVLRSIAEAGHEVGNHSFKHEPWLHLYEEAQIEEELAHAEEAIERATGRRPTGFRGPGFSLSRATLRVLHRRGYRYDCSTFPTFIGPLARAFYFSKSPTLDDQQKRQRELLFGRFDEGLRPNQPYRWALDEGELLEIPVTVLPGLRVPIHVSYLLYLAAYSPALASAYWAAALAACRLNGVGPSLLLHPLDFLGREDDRDGALAFFPAMQLGRELKMRVVCDAIDRLARGHRVVPMSAHAEALAADRSLRRVTPRFATEPGGV
jgi:hypothetical protein